MAPKSILKSQFNNNKKVLDKESVNSKVLVHVHENKPNSEIEPFIAVKRDNIGHEKSTHKCAQNQITIREFVKWKILNIFRSENLKI